MKNRSQAYGAELLGTFALTLAVLLSISGESASLTPVVAGLVVGLFVYTVGGISGTHLNPAVTVAMLSVKKIKPADAGAYILVQLIGAMLAAAVVNTLGVPQINLAPTDSLVIAAAEAVGAFILVFGIASVAYGKTPPAAAGLVIGGSLVLGIRLTAGFSNGVLNPAVAIGIGSVSMTYLVAPIAGGLLAVWCYKWLIEA